MSVILGSGSPRRLDLLRSVGIEPRVVSPDIDESVLDGELPVDYVRRLASAKLDAVMKTVGAVNVGAIVIAADTTVDVDGVIFGKPVDDAEAVKMLLALSGRSHQVHTGFAVAVAGPGCRGVDWDGHVEVVSSTVTFRCRDVAIRCIRASRLRWLDQVVGESIGMGTSKSCRAR